MFKLEIFGSGVEVLTQCVYSNFGKWLEIYPMHSRNYFQNGIFEEDYQRSSEKLTSFYIEISMANKIGQELATSLFSGYQICPEAFF